MKRVWHALRKEQILKELESNEKGLSGKQVKQKLKSVGYNVLPEKKKEPYIYKVIRQFKSPLIYILIIAAVISFIFGHIIDAYVIFAIILINASIGLFQEHKAETAIQALKRMVVSYAKVYRDGKLEKINSENLVPGDIILLESGDKIPADARIIEIKNLRVNEASLTGESVPVDKTIELYSEKTALADRKNLVFMGTIAVDGTAKAIVVETGSTTSIGKVAKSIEHIKRDRLHFKEKLDKLAIQMGIFAIGGALLTFLIGFLIRGLDFFEIFLFTIASLVSGIPEGLPAVLVIVLSVSAYRMAKKNAIVRHLPSIESIGATTVIATDKTGTLTQNVMVIEKIYLPSQGIVEVSGNGWENTGKFKYKNKIIAPIKNLALKKVLEISALCNRSKVMKKGKDYDIIGDPTEAALDVLAEKTTIKQDMEKIKKVEDDMPFDSHLKYRSCLIKNLNKTQKEIYCVGAFEKIIEKCTSALNEKGASNLFNKDKKEIFDKGIELASQGMRVLALAYKEVPLKITRVEDKFIDNLVFVGLVAMKDPLRKGVKDAILKAKEAGIRVIMKTGDHKETAVAIAKEINLIKEGEEDKVLTQSDLERMSKSQFAKAVKTVSVFARVTPNMKLKIVEALQKQGEVVAVTGDGVNDAPALTKADIGVAMGKIGTDVARESSEIVLTDDNFVSIVNAVEEGRITFNNIRRTSFYLVTSNAAEDITIISALCLGMPLPLLPVQILWLNLVTDGLTDVSLATEQGHKTVMGQPPKNPKENILSMKMMPYLIIISVLMAVLTILFFNLHLDNLDKARTAAFSSMAFLHLFHVLNMRSMSKSVFKIGPFTNKWVNWALIISVGLLIMAIYVPFFQDIFGFSSLSLLELIATFLCGALVLVAAELYKYYLNKKGKVIH